MFDVERLNLLGPSLTPPFGGGALTGGEFAQPNHMAAERGGEFLQDFIGFDGVGSSHGVG